MPKLPPAIGHYLAADAKIMAQPIVTVQLDGTRPSFCHDTAVAADSDGIATATDIRCISQ